LLRTDYGRLRRQAGAFSFLDFGNGLAFNIASAFSKKLNNIPEVRNPACHDRDVVTCLILRKFIEI
jgi:hypothetical protein